MAGEERIFGGGKPDPLAEELQFFRDALHYSYFDQLDVDAFLRAAMAARRSGAYTYQGMDFGRAAPPPVSAERQAALDQCRKIKRLRDSTTFEGERAAAQRRMDGIMAKHAIAAHEV